MYRQYEDPHALEKRLAELKEELHRAYALGAEPYMLEDIEIDIASVKERINFAWQDDEYDSEY